MAIRQEQTIIELPSKVGRNPQLRATSATTVDRSRYPQANEELPNTEDLEERNTEDLANDEPTQTVARRASVAAARTLPADGDPYAATILALRSDPERTLLLREPKKVFWLRRVVGKHLLPVGAGMLLCLGLYTGGCALHAEFLQRVSDPLTFGAQHTAHASALLFQTDSPAHLSEIVATRDQDHLVLYVRGGNDQTHPQMLIGPQVSQDEIFEIQTEHGYIVVRIQGRPGLFQIDRPTRIFVAHVVDGKLQADIEVQP